MKNVEVYFVSMSVGGIMITFCSKKAALLVLFVGMQVATISAVCPNGRCGRRVQFATQPMPQGAQYRQPAPQPVKRPVAQPDMSQQEKRMQDEEARVQQESLRTFNQEQEKRATQLQNEDDVIAASLQTHQEEELARAQLKHGIANSLVNEDEIAVSENTKEIKKPTTAKDRIKGWFKTKWAVTKDYASFIKDYVKDACKAGWSKTKNGSKNAWAKTKLAFKKVWFKINPDLNRVNQNQKATLPLAA